MKVVKIALALAMTLFIASVSYAAITSTGGTEDFDSVGTLADGDQLSAANIGQISGWTLDPSSGANLYFYYDNNDTSAFTTASGAGTKPAGSGNFNIKNITGQGTMDNSRVISTQMTFARQISISGWFAVSDVIYGNNVRVGIWFPGASTTSNKGSIHLDFLMDNAGVNRTKDVGLIVRGEVSASAGNETLNVGSSGLDDTDFALNEWNEFQINITTSDSAEGSAELIFNGATIGSIALKADSSSIMLSGHCFILTWANTIAGNMYVDDLDINAGASSVDDWMMF